MVSETENHILMLETAKNVKFRFLRQKKKKNHSFFADTMLQVNQSKRKNISKSLGLLLMYQREPNEIFQVLVNWGFITKASLQISSYLSYLGSKVLQSRKTMFLSLTELV